MGHELDQMRQKKVVKKKDPKDPEEKERKRKKKTMKGKKVMAAKVSDVGFIDQMEEERVYSLPGQKHDTPGERDPLRIFYEVLYQQLPNCELAATWMMEWGLLPPDEAKKVHEKMLKKDLQHKLGSSGRLAPGDKISTPAARKLDKMASKSLSRSKKRKIIDSSCCNSRNDSVSQKKKMKKQKLST